MESVASNSSPPPQYHRYHRINPTQSLTERVIRAVSHHLRLLHRSDTTFYVLGATGNVYTVTLSSTPTCSCPDRTTPCKHILFVYIRVLNISLDDTCIWRRTLRPCQLNRLLSTPMSTQALAGPNIRAKFHQLYFQNRFDNNNDNDNNNSRQFMELEDGTSCPICLEELKREEKLVACGTCRNMLHEECFSRWKRSSRRRSTSCVICRARWRSVREREDQERYLNLSAYVIDEDAMVEGDAQCGS